MTQMFPTASLIGLVYILSNHRGKGSITKVIYSRLFDSRLINSRLMTILCYVLKKSLLVLKIIKF